MTDQDRTALVEQLKVKWRERAEWLRQGAYPDGQRGSVTFEAAYLEAARAADDFAALQGDPPASPALSSPAPEAPEDRRQRDELLSAARAVLAQFAAIQAHQFDLLVRDQTLESASANWDKATLGLSIDFQPLIDAVASVESATDKSPTGEQGPA